MLSQSTAEAVHRIARMRRATQLLGFALLLTAAIIPLAAALAKRPPHAEPEKPTPAIDLVNTEHPFSNTITINNIRVTLLSFGHQTLFEQDEHGASHAVPYLEILFVVESLTNESIKYWDDGLTDIELNGQHARTTTQRVSNYAFDRIPDGTWDVKVNDPRRASGRRIWIRDDGLPSGLATLTLHQGANGNKQTFQFTAVPLR